MNKIYKVKVDRYLLSAHIFFAVAIFSLLMFGLGKISRMDSIVVSLLSLYLIFWFGYAISHRIELSIDSREINQRVFGIKYKAIKIDEIKQYFLNKNDTHNSWAMGIIGSLPTGRFNTYLNLKLNYNGVDIFKEVYWNISPEDAKDLFSKAREANNTIIQANEPFYHNILYKPLQLKYPIIIIVIAVIGFLFFFFQFLNNIMEAPF